MRLIFAKRERRERAGEEQRSDKRGRQSRRHSGNKVKWSTRAVKRARDADTHLNRKTHSDNREEVKREGAGRREVHVQTERGRKRGRERRARSVACLQFVPETLKMHCAQCRQRRSGDGDGGRDRDRDRYKHIQTHA